MLQSLLHRVQVRVHLFTTSISRQTTNEEYIKRLSTVCHHMHRSYELSKTASFLALPANKYLNRCTTSGAFSCWFIRYVCYRATRLLSLPYQCHSGFISNARRAM